MNKFLSFSLLITLSSLVNASSIDRNLLNRADSGDRTAQEEVAKFYEFTGSDGESLSWLYKAAENGSGYAATKIAKAYNNGTMGLKKNTTEAKIWYKKGALLNDKEALLYMSDYHWNRSDENNKNISFQYLLRCINEVKAPECYINYAKNKRIVNGNLDENAFKAISQAANMNSPEAFTELAFYMENGYIVKKDVARAYKYLAYAASKNEKNALEKIGEAYLLGNNYELKKDEVKGIDFLERAGRLGSGEAYRTLGDYYFIDDKNKADLDKAIFYYEKGIELGNPYAAWNLASLYSENSKNLGKSQEYYKREMAKLMKMAADAGLLRAQLALARAYEKGQLNLYPRERAKYYYDLAAKQGSGEAKLKLKGFN